MSEVAGPLPTFLIIGAQKSATRWLRTNVGLHPHIYAAQNELWFFNNVQKRFHVNGVDWYRAQFVESNGEPFLGEATPGYMMPRHEPEVVAKRIKRVVPDVRLIAILRNPVDRANSAMVHQVKRRRLRGSTNLVELLKRAESNGDRFELIGAGRYAAALQPYVELFGDQLLVLLHDDIATDAEGVYRDAVAHIGARTDFVPPDLEQVRYSNRTAVKTPSGLTPEDRVAAYTYFRDDVARLEQLLGRDFSIWDPTGGGERTVEGSSQLA